MCHKIKPFCVPIGETKETVLLHRKDYDSSQTVGPLGLQTFERGNFGFVSPTISIQEGWGINTLVFREGVPWKSHDSRVVPSRVGPTSHSVSRKPRLLLSSGVLFSALFYSLYSSTNGGNVKHRNQFILPLNAIYVSIVDKNN